MRYRV